MSESWYSEVCPSCDSVNWINDDELEEHYRQISGYLCWNCDEAISFIEPEDWDIQRGEYLAQGWESPS